MTSTTGPRHEIVVKVDGDTKIDGIETLEGTHIKRIQVDCKLDSPDFFMVEYLCKIDQEIKWVDFFRPGMPVEISMGYGDAGGGAGLLMKGEINYVEPNFCMGDPTIVISGYDVSHHMTIGTNSQVFGDGHQANYAPGKAAKEVVGSSGAREGGTSDGLSADADESGAKVEYIAQYNQNEYSFVQQVIGSFGFGYTAGSAESEKKLVLKAVETSEDPVLTICYEKLDPADATQADTTNFCMSTVRQIAKVEVRGWDGPNKVSFKGEATKADVEAIEGKTGIEQTGTALYGSGSNGRVITIVDCPVRDADEAKQVATSLLNRLAMGWMRADITIEGRSCITAGKMIKLNGYGKFYDGKYLVEQCQHVWIAGSAETYKTIISAARNSSPT